MSVEDREKTQYNWTHDKVQIIAATIAFGMGAFFSAFRGTAQAQISVYD